MNLNNVDITISAVWQEQYPDTDMLEFAFAGRSNVGKSSFINKMLNRTKLARTSGKPGKTATLNFYNIDDTMFFVDLPGYGYAKVSKSEKKKWAEMIETYLKTREQLTQTILIVDARHKPTQEDLVMLNWIRHRHESAVVVATKLDKLRKMQIEPSLQLIRDTLRITYQDVLIPFSAETGQGVEEAWEVINAFHE